MMSVTLPGRGVRAVSDLTTKVLDKGFVTLLNLAGPTRRPEGRFDADDRDPANSARVSFNARDTRPREDDLKLNKYLWKHHHSTPFEMIETWWEMKLPVFVARQLVRHRTVSLNEVSRRYVDDEVEFYVPKEWRRRAKNKKQGSDGVVFVHSFDYDRAMRVVKGAYEDLLELGVAPEQARIVLPQGMYPRWLWKQDLRNVLHMLSLRMASDAQWETRQYAFAMFGLLRKELPDLMEACGVVQASAS